MSKFILTVGISGSGKSTWARSIIEPPLTEQLLPTSFEEDKIRINRDELRQMIFGYTEQNINEYYSCEDFNWCEKKLNGIIDDIIEGAIRDNKTIIMDNTHLKRSYIDEYKKWGIPIELSFFRIDVDTAINRDSNRIRKVGEKVIKRQYQQYKSLLNELAKDFDEDVKIRGTLNYYEGYKAPKYDSSKPDCYIFDIDGTLALKHQDRNWYEYDKVKDDSEITYIADIMRHLLLKGGNQLYICTGRDDSCKEETIDWLESIGIPLLGFQVKMRKTGDNRPDWMVKREMFTSILRDCNIVCIYDDRSSIVRLAQSMQIPVLHVKDPNNK